VSSLSRSETVRELARETRADGEGVPHRRDMSLMTTGGGVRTSIIKDAVREAGHDLDDPGVATHLWFRELDIVVIDLRAEEEEEDG